MWKNFKRHGLEKHGEAGRFSCSQCTFRANRNETLMRHIDNRHKGHKIVSILLDNILSKVVADEMNAYRDTVVSILDDIIASVVAPDLEDAEMIMEEENRVFPQISAYEKVRNDRVAEIQMEFEREFPSFRKEVEDLRIVKKPRPRKMRHEMAGSRKSSRIQEQSFTVRSWEMEEGATSAGPETQDAGDCSVRDRSVVLTDSDEVNNGAGDMDTGVLDLESSDMDEIVHETSEIVNEAGAVVHEVVGVSGDVVVESTVEVLEAGAGVQEVGAGIQDTGAEVLDAGAEVQDAGAVAEGAEGKGLGRFACLPCNSSFRY